MANFDNASDAATFVGFPVGQLIGKKVTKAFTIWVYETVVIKTMGKKTISWNPGALELFAVNNKIPLGANYVPSEKMKLIPAYNAELDRVYKGFRSVVNDRENGIVRDFSEANRLGKLIGITFTH